MRSSYRLLCLSLCVALGASEALAQKRGSVFFDPRVMSVIQTNVKGDDWSRSIREQAVEAAQPWFAMTDDTLWGLMFSERITRSWMVWSNGHCPACKKPVPMYNWKIAALDRPWKVQCPDCKEYFPKNDFAAFYRSGLDEHGLFDPEKADRKLLFNLDHPDVNDPLRLFGVDDGEGFSDGQNRWRFIGHYLTHGQWKQVVLNGIRRLAAAYVLTQDPLYARKAAILLDRVADVYGRFDYVAQGLSYERRDSIIGHGYVTVWHDACEETREMALAYDMIFDGMRNDRGLVTYISKKADVYKPPRAKRTLADIRANIETGILRDALRNRRKIESNFPNTEAAVSIIETILGWPDRRRSVMETIDRFVEKATRCDGLSGEKGLAGYSAITSQNLARFLALYDRLDSDLLSGLLKRHPKLARTFLFHVATLVNEQYYPRIGDTGGFGQKTGGYCGAVFSNNPVSHSYPFTSIYSLFRNLHALTGDPTYVKLLFKANGNSIEGLPYDPLCRDSQGFRGGVGRTIQQVGVEIPARSFNMEEWCLAMLYSGTGRNQRALWIDYDIGGNHCHADGMNIGLFARGLDLLPDFGYAPVQFGGWFSPHAVWYRKTAAHNTVVVDGTDQMPGVGKRETAPLAEQLNPLKNHQAGKTTLWMPGRQVQGIRASGAGLYRGATLRQYERTVGLIDVDSVNAYVLDLFRVVGGSDHAKFTHGSVGGLATEGLATARGADYGHETMMSSFSVDPEAPIGWQATWSIRDQWGYLPETARVKLCYQDFTERAEAGTARTWISLGYDSAETHSLMVRRRGEQKNLRTAFVDLFEPCEGDSRMTSGRRMKLVTPGKETYGEMHVGLQIRLAGGLTDLILAMDVEDPQDVHPSFKKIRTVLLPEWGVTTDAEFCLVRLDESRNVRKIALAHGTFLGVGDLSVSVEAPSRFVEMDLWKGRVTVLTGDPRLVKDVRLKTKSLPVEGAIR